MITPSEQDLGEWLIPREAARRARLSGRDCRKALESVGWIAYLEVLGRRDPSRRFRSLASIRVRGAMIDYLRRGWDSRRGPRPLYYPIDDYANVLVTNQDPALTAEAKGNLARFKRRLSTRDYSILVGSMEGVSLRDMAADHGLSEMRLSQIRAKWRAALCP